MRPDPETRGRTVYQTVITMNWLRRWAGRSILNRLTAISIGVSAGLLVTVALIAFPLFYAQAEANIEERYRDILDRTQEQIQFRIAAVLDSQDELAANSFVVNAFVDSTGRELYLLPTLRDYRPPFGIAQALALFDSNLSVFGHAGPNLPLTPVAEDVVQKALDAGRTQMRVEDTTGGHRLLFAVPVFYPPASSYEGVLLSSVDPGELLRPVFGKLSRDDCLEVSVGGRHLLASDCSADRVAGRMSIGGVMTKDADGDAFLTLSFGDATASPLGVLLPIAILYAAVSLVALMLVYLATRLIGRPFADKLEELAQAADALALDPRSPARARWDHPDEIGRVTQAFDTLVAKWRDIQFSLEEQVARRTAQLAIALEQAQASNRAKGEFLAVMSHEIRTPMNGVVGMIQALETTQLNEAQRGQLRVIKSSSGLLLRIIDDLLDFSRIDAGRLELDLAPFRLDLAVREVATSLAHGAAANHVELRLRPVPSSLSQELIGDETRLRQVITNLVHNAIKFTLPGGTVDLDVRAETQGEALAIDIVIEDTGIGIDAAKRQRIFEPFEQADRTTSRRYGGTGLGLAIVKRLIELMGGTIGVESDPGRGSRFTISLALAIAAKPPPVEHMAPSAPASFGHLRILVAEDNPVNQMVASAQLQSLGIDQVTLAEDGRAAISAALDSEFDLILVDIQMPEFDGLEATAALQQAGVKTPIVAMTANVMEEDRAAYRRAGMVDCLAKPIDLGRLREVIERHAVSTVLQGQAGDAAGEGLEVAGR